MRENLEQQKNRAAAIMARLRERWPDADCTLRYSEGWQLLFAAILAAQCTDERVNIITAELFREWPQLSFYAEASQEEMEKRVRSCGLYRHKAANIRAGAAMLLERFNGEIPRTRGELLELPGVGQKIANLILGDYFRVPAIVVDTHCGRISRLLALSDADEPRAVERDLLRILPEEDWIDYGHLLVTLGRNFCKARCRQCALCPLTEHCRYAVGQAAAIAAARQAGEDHACL